MKTFLRFLLATGLLLGLAASSLAAVHGYQGYFGDFLPAGASGLLEMEFSLLTPAERTFSVADQTPRFTADGLFGTGGTDINLVNLEYSRNDFTFGDLMYLSNAEDAYGLRGGYLWEDSGVFAGLDYLKGLGDSGYIASGGYRFDLGAGSYATASLDYYGGAYGGYYAVEGTANYRTKEMKLTGQLNVDEDGEYQFHAKANIAAGKNLVWGAGFTWFDSDSRMFFAGATWENNGWLVDGVAAVEEDGDKLYRVSGMYNFSDSLAAGIGYLYGGEGIISLQGRYLLDAGAVKLSYARPVDGDGDGIIGLGYEMEF